MLSFMWFSTFTHKILLRKFTPVLSSLQFKVLATILANQSYVINLNILINSTNTLSKFSPSTIGEGNGKSLQHSCLESPMNSLKRQKNMTLKDEPLGHKKVRYD